MPKGVKRSAGLLSRTDDERPHDAPAKKARHMGTATGSEEKDKDVFGNPYWPISNKRGVTVSTSKNLTFVNIREFYDKDKNGENHPGKGISLLPEQWSAFLKAIPAINEHLASQGIEVDAPATKSAASDKKTEKPAKDDGKPAKPKKANIEATSDEDEDGNHDRA